MKATGIIRRIDDLGRIVIPKEIRKQLKITEGENMEIFIDDNEHIILKKYSNLKNVEDIARKITDSIYSFLKNNIIITDNTSVIAVSGKNKKDLINKDISNNLLKIIKKRENIVERNVNIVDNIEINGNYKINMITNNGDVNGLLIFIKEEEKTKEEEKIIDLETKFLSKYLEE